MNSVWLCPLLSSLVFTFAFILMLNTMYFDLLSWAARSPFFCFHFPFYHRHRYHQLPSCRHSLNLNNFCLDDVYAANRQNSSDKKNTDHAAETKMRKICWHKIKARTFLFGIFEREKKTPATERKKIVILIAGNMRFGWIPCRHVCIDVICSKYIHEFRTCK